MNRFQKLNPSVQFMFYLFSIVIVLALNSLLFSLISLGCALLNSVYVNHKKVLKSALYSILVVAFVTVFNMIFVHRGETVLFEISEIKFTLEAMTYGINQGLIISSVFIWFSVMSKSLDSEMVTYLMRFTPKFALMFSMILGFIPRFSHKLSDIRASRLALNGGEKKLTKKEQLWEAIEIFSALITYSLESSIITANSMEGRGYNPRAIRKGRYKFSFYDLILIALMIGLVILMLLLSSNIKAVLLAIFGLIPCIINLKEEILWKLSKAEA